MPQPDSCRYPRCRRPSCVSLYEADGLLLCEKHWSQYCAINLPDQPTAADILTFERRKLAFEVRCKWRPAVRALRMLDADPDAYRLQFVRLSADSPPMTLREHVEASNTTKTNEEQRND